MAENCEKYLRKGLKVAIEGRLQTGSYKNKNGDTVYTTDVIANRVEFLEWPNQQQGGGQGYQPQQPQQPQYQALAPSPAPAPEIPPAFDEIDEDIPF